ADAERAIEEAGGAHEEALPAQARLHQLVGERGGDAERARTGQDEDRGGHIEGAAGRAADRERDDEAAERGGEHAEDVERRESTAPAGRAGGVELARSGRAQERNQRRGGEVDRGHARTGAPTHVEGAGRDSVAADEAPRRALAVDPVERERGLVLVDQRLD